MTIYEQAKKILKQKPKKITIKGCNNPNVADTINEKVQKDDYLDMMKRFVAFCESNHKYPSYILTKKSKTKVSLKLFGFCVGKIESFVQKNGKLPNYCIFNKADTKKSKKSASNTKKNTNTPISSCSNPYISSPYNKQSGCDAMGQNTNYYCGVSALQKVLYKFGIHVSQKQLASVAGTTTKGTDHQGLKTAVAWVSKQYGVKLTVKEYNFSELGFEKIAKMICKPNVDIIWHLLYRNKYGHYEKVKAIDLKKGTVDVINSLGNKCSNNCFCGYIETRSFATQKQYINGISQKSIIVITKG